MFRRHSCHSGPFYRRDPVRGRANLLVLEGEGEQKSTRKICRRVANLRTVRAHGPVSIESVFGDLQSLEVGFWVWS